MLIRPAQLTDLNDCLTLHANSQTEHVWQMEEREEHDSIAIRFQQVRLPRVMRVTYPRRRDDLLSCWENGALVFVAADRPIATAEEEPDTIYGYCQLDVCSWQQAGWISHLIIDRRVRRNGLGTALLKTAAAAGKKAGLQRLMIAVQTKNYPGISFCEKHGFSFCGYNDYYFVNRDIALFFALKI